MKTRKNFAFDSKTIKLAEKRAKQEKRSLTVYLEILILNDVIKKEI